MLRYTVGRDDKVLGEFTGEQIKDQVRSGELLESDLVYTEGFGDWKPIGEVPELQDVEAHPSLMSDTPSWKKVIGCSVLFAILTFWFSEAVFRPAPSANPRESSGGWKGWIKVISGNSNGSFSHGGGGNSFNNVGPVYLFVRAFYDDLNIDKLVKALPLDKIFGRTPLSIDVDRSAPNDFVALLMWVITCSIAGPIIGYIWRKKSKASGVSFSLKKYRKPIIITASIMSLMIVVVEGRNAITNNSQEKNKALITAVKEGDIEAVKKHLDSGAKIKMKGQQDEKYSYSALDMATKELHGVKMAQKLATEMDLHPPERFQKQIDTRNKIVELLREHGGKE